MKSLRLPRDAQSRNKWRRKNNEATGEPMLLVACLIFFVHLFLDMVMKNWVLKWCEHRCVCMCVLANSVAYCVIFGYKWCIGADSVKSYESSMEKTSVTPGNGSESSAEQNLIVEDVPSLLGVLLGFRNLMHLTCDSSLTAASTADQHKGSSRAKVTEMDATVDIMLVLRV